MMGPRPRVRGAASEAQKLFTTLASSHMSSCENSSPVAAEIRVLRHQVNWVDVRRVFRFLVAPSQASLSNSRLAGSGCYSAMRLRTPARPFLSGREASPCGRPPLSWVVCFASLGWGVRSSTPRQLGLPSLLAGATLAAPLARCWRLALREGQPCLA